jgi:hypothetical protein
VQWLYVVSFISGACSVVGGGAEQVPDQSDRPRQADRCPIQVRRHRFRLAPAGAGLAGILIQWLTAPYAVILNALGFVVSIALLRNVKANDPKPPSNKHPLRDIQDGFRFIWSQPLLRTLAWAGLWHLLFYGFAALHVIFATRELGMTPGMLGWRR